MRSNNWNYWIGELDALQDFRPNDGMNLHLFKLFRSQTPWLGDDVLRNGELTDVMEQRCGPQSFEFVLRQFQLLGDLDRIDTNAFQMVVRSLVFCFDGQRKGFNRTQVKLSHF